MKRSIFIIFLFCSLRIVAQVSTVLPNQVPPSPNAQTFTKYGEFPVSNYTGVPDITIPLYTIPLKDISIPISISYNASGIKVDEEASRVGLGWTLNAGGVMSQTIMGRYNDFEDELYFNSIYDSNLKDLTEIYPSGFRKYTIGSYNGGLPFTYPGTNTLDFFSALSGDSNSCGVVELAPDVFNYSFMGYSGKFIFLHTGKIVKEKEDNLIIEDVQQNSNRTGLKSWKITTPDGTKYYFNKAECCTLQSGRRYNSSFYLTSIETINGTIVTFSYSNFNAPQTYGLFSKFEGCKQGMAYERFISYASYDVVVLDKISYPGGETRFEYAYDRKDYLVEPRLNAIYINEGGTDSFKWVFDYGYFTSNIRQNELPTIKELNSAISGSASIYNDNWNQNRLKLNGLKRTMLDNSLPYSYKFLYNEGELPTKLSMAKDHWNYYNGRNNFSLIPSITHDESLDPAIINVSYGGSENTNRETNEAKNQAFILKEITYPTGGKTTFTYEANKYKTNIFENDPHKRDFLYYNKRTTIKTSPGERNAGTDWNQSKEISLPNSNISAYSVSIFFKVSVDLTFANRYGRALNLEIYGNNNSRYWNYTYTADQLPQGSRGSYVYNNSWKIKLPPGSYTVKASGNLISCIDSLNLDVNLFLSPDLYLSMFPVGLAGGVRVKEVNSFNSDGLKALGKRYTYTLDGSSSELQSSGKLMFYPRYQDKVNSYSSSGLRGGGYSVGYSKVFVSDFDGSGKELGKSSYEYINIPDRNLYYAWEDQSSPVDARLKVKDENPPGIGGFKFSENGTLLKETNYKEGGLNPVKETIFDYGMLGDGPYIVWGVLKSDRITVGNGNCAQGTTPAGWDLLLSEKPTDLAFGYLYPAIRPMQVCLQKKTEIIYENIGSIKKISSYQYNSKNFISKEVISSNSEDLITKTYTYPSDINAGDYASMVSLNMLNYPIEQTMKRKDLTIASKLTTYKPNNGIYVLDKIYSLKSNFPITSFTPFDGFLMDQNYNLLNPDAIVVRYDARNNPLQTTEKNGITVSYLWDMSGTYLLAKVQGVSYSQIESLTGKECTFNSASLYSSIKNLVPNALISTYSYKPLVGMVSQTDFYGQTTYYEYDSCGRLLRMKDKDGSIVKLYDYNYKQ